MRWKFLFIKFRSECYWWSIVFLAKNFFVNLAFVVVVHGVAQLYLVLAVIVIYTALVVFWMPYRYRIANLLELCASVSILLATSLLTWFADRGEGEYDDAMSGTIAAVSFTPIAIAVACFARVLFSSVARRALDSKNKQTDFTLLKKMGECLASLENHEGLFLIAHLGEWDRAVLVRAAQVFESVALGAHRGSRIDDGALPRRLSALWKMDVGIEVENGFVEGGMNYESEKESQVQAEENTDAALEATAIKHKVVGTDVKNTLILV